MTNATTRDVAVTASCAAELQVESGGRNPDDLQYGAWINAVIHPDIKRAREAIRGGLSVFAHFSGFAGANTNKLDEGTRRAAEFAPGPAVVKRRGGTAVTEGARVNRSGQSAPIGQAS